VSVRLNKYLAERGVASRRACDRLIAEGRVRINGRVVSELGTQVEEQRDRVTVNGRAVGGAERHVYYVLNKPVGVITTLDDPEGRRTVKELLPRGARVYPVGRLDADTSGLLLLTNDGELAHKLMHPRYGVAKVYRVRLAREPRPDQLRRLAGGVRFDRERVSGPARARRIDPGFDAIMIEMVVHEGRFRQVRKMCEAVGLEVTGLHRVGYGPLRLGPLARGMYRELSDEEVVKLRAESARAGRSAPRAPGAPARARPARPAPAEVDAPGDDDTREETWMPGVGYLEPEREAVRERPSGRAERASGSTRQRPAEWPARATGRRGDADWQPTADDTRRRGPGVGSPRGPGMGSPRRPSPGGPRRSSPDGPRRPSPGGPRRSSTVGPRRSSTVGPRRQSPGGPRGQGPGGPRRSGPAGPRRSGSGGSRRSSPAGSRRSSFDGSRRSSPAGSRRSSLDGSRPRGRGGEGIAERRVPARGRRPAPRKPSRRKPR
jgi:23S rRNA pseudouridine2605 synthase